MEDVLRLQPHTRAWLKQSALEAHLLGYCAYLCQTARNVDPQSASKTDPALREVLGSLGPVIAEICGAGVGSTPTDVRVLLPSWSGVIR